MEFVTIDFETASRQANSACEIGLTFVCDQQITETRSWLIRPVGYPHFDYFNILIHKIRPLDVAEKPSFDALWPDILPLIENKFLIAHNAGFDMGVLSQTLEAYNIPVPELSFACSYRISKKVWPQFPAFGLASLCKILEIDLNHHRAGPDSRATAEIAIRAFELAGVNSPGDLPEKLNLTVGKLSPGLYLPSLSRSRPQVVGDPTKNQPDNLFFGKSVVFTGKLYSMTRAKAELAIADIGGFPERSVNRTTDFLVVGQQDYRVVGEAGMSRKQKDAYQLAGMGARIEVISEVDFLKNIGSAF